MTGKQPSRRARRIPVDECAALLRHTDLFKRLDDDDLGALVRAGTLRGFGQGETIAGPDDGAVYVIVDSAARTYRLSADGNEITLLAACSASLLGVESLAGGCEARNVVVATAPDTLVLRVAADRFEELVVERPAIALQVVLPLLTRGIADACDLIEDLALYDVSTRVAHTLAKLARASEDHTVGISRGELAHLVGTTPERVCRLMSHMRDLGLIDFKPYGHRVRVLEFEGLASFMSHDALAPITPDISIEVADVDAVHAEAVRRGEKIVYPLTDEPWGVRRFFVLDPNGVTLNVMSHRAG